MTENRVVSSDGVTSTMEIDKAEEEDDAFESFSLLSSGAANKSKKMKMKKGMISISIKTKTIGTTKEMTDSTQDKDDEEQDDYADYDDTDTNRPHFWVNQFSKPVDVPSFIKDQGALQSEHKETVRDRQWEEAFAFYSETHEDQDPDVWLFTKTKEIKALEEKLDELQKFDEEQRKEIDSIVQQQHLEKSASANRNMARLKEKHQQEEEREMEKLRQAFKVKMHSNQKRIHQGLQLLSRRHDQEQTKLMSEHQHQIRRQGMIAAEPVTTAQLQRVQARLKQRHTAQMQEFQQKGAALNKNCEMEFAKEREKKAAYYARRRREMELGVQKVFGRMQQNFQKSHQSYIKRHERAMTNKRDAITTQIEALKKERRKRYSPEQLKEEQRKEEVIKKQKKESEEKARAKEQPKDKRDEKTKIGGSDWAKEFLESGGESGSAEQPEELCPPEPCRSKHATLTAVVDEKGKAVRSNAATRLKNRKAIMNQINKQLAVEIHNEGLWIFKYVETRKDPKAQQQNKKDEETPDEEFIPWGVKARTILHTIVSGEIPFGFGDDRFVWGDRNDVITGQGGHIRCVVTDLRTGELTASKQRAEGVRLQEEHSIAELEAKVTKLADLLVETERNLKKAEEIERSCADNMTKAQKDVERAQKLLQEFRTKFAKYFNAEGNPITESSSDRQKLMNANLKYKNNVEQQREKERKAQKDLADAKAATVKLQASIKHTQKSTSTASALLKKRKLLFQDIKGGASGMKSLRTRLSEAAEIERASTRVTDTIAAFRRAAEQRRQELANKRSAAASTKFVRDVDAVPSALKKSLWLKMHRRRQQIVLRPSIDFMVEEIRKIAKSKFLDSTRETNESRKKNGVEQAENRAEALFLRSVYPVTPDEGLPNIPQKDSTLSWAEPGSRLNLSVPKDTRPRGILPVAPFFKVAELANAEFMSSAGRQAVDCLTPHHLKALSAPLSAISQAISLSETQPLAPTSGVSLLEGDPLNISDTAMEIGYSFALKPTRAPASTSRRKSGSENPESAAEKVTQSAAASSRSSSSSAAALAMAKSTSSTPKVTQKRSSKTERPQSSTKRRASSKATANSGSGMEAVTPKAKKARRTSSEQQQTPTHIQQQQQHAYLQQVNLAARGLPSTAMDPYSQTFLKQPVAAIQPGQIQIQAQQTHLLPQPPPPPPQFHTTATASPQQAAYQRHHQQQQTHQQQQQQHHQRQMAQQMRMIQQQQQHQQSPQPQQHRGTTASAYGQSAASMQFFGQPLSQPAAMSRGSFAAPPPPQASLTPPPQPGGHPSSRRTSVHPQGNPSQQKGNDNERNDPLFMLKH